MLQEWNCGLNTKNIANLKFQVYASFKPTMTKPMTRSLGRPVRLLMIINANSVRAEAISQYHIDPSILSLRVLSILGSENNEASVDPPKYRDNVAKSRSSLGVALY